MVRMGACRVPDRGSIPRRGVVLFHFFLFPTAIHLRTERNPQKLAPAPPSINEPSVPTLLSYNRPALPLLLAIAIRPPYSVKDPQRPQLRQLTPPIGYAILCITIIYRKTTVCTQEAFTGSSSFSLQTHIHSDVSPRKPAGPSTFYMLRILRFRAIRTPVVDLRRAADPSPYKKWFELSTVEKDVFVSTFRDIYRNRYPASGTNSKLHMLLPRTHDPYDTPSLFGIFYDDIWKVVNRTNRDNHRFSDQSFKSLLVRRRA